MQPIRITSWPPHMNKETEPVQPVQINIYQSNSYRKNLSWLHLDDELVVQEKQQLKD